LDGLALYAAKREIERRLIGSNLGSVAGCSAEIVMVDIDRALSSNSNAEPVVKKNIRSNSNAPRQDTSRQSQDDPNRDRAEFDAEDILISTSSNSKPSSGSAGRARTPRSSPSHMSPSEIEVNSQYEAAPISWKTIEIVKDEGDRIAGDVTAREPERRSSLLKSSGIHWVYRPVWDFQNSALILFALLPRRSDNSELEDEVTAATPLDAGILAELDNGAVMKAARDFTDLSRSARRLPLLVQVHYETVVDERRRAFFLATIKKIPSQHHRLLFFEIVGRPQDGSTPGISSFGAALQAIHVRTAIRVNPSWPSFSGMERCGVELATMTLPAILPEAAQMNALGTMADRALDAKLECGVWNIGTRSMVIAAASSGIRYLSGSAIAQDLPNLSCALRFSLADLYPHS
jgi:hypothetical protein